MRAVITALSLLSGMLLLGACTGESRSQSRRVGGCEADTISMDIGAVISRCDISSPVRISILSVEHAGDETYRKAAAGLVTLLDSLGVGICGVPRLVIIREGPCWPRHRIDFRLEKGSDKLFQEIRSALAGGMLAGSRPSKVRPENYGLFFVQAGVGSTDRWTLWYGRPPH